MNKTEILKKELNNIDIMKLTSEMIKIPSYSFMENQEKEIAAYIHDFFTNEGIECNVIEIEPGRFNVVACIHGNGNCDSDNDTNAVGSKNRSLMLSGHMDTVPAYDMEDPFIGRIQDGKVFGRGACDMKGALAAMMAAMAAIKRGKIQLSGDLYFTGVADEEEEGKGVRYLIEHGPFCDGAVVGEPHSMHIAPGHKGLEWIKVTFQGYKVHAGHQKEGINAIEMTSRFVREVYETYTPILDSRAYPILGAPTINVGTIRGGDQPSTVPDYCEIRLDRRMVPTETIEQVYSELKDIADKLHKEDPRFQGKIEDVFGGTTLPHLPFALKETDPLIEAAKSALIQAGITPQIEAFPAWTDAGFMAAETDIHCMVMGPGDLSVAHSVNEYISKEQLDTAALVYGLMAIDYCK